MYVAAIRVDLRIRDARSLKDKRAVVKRLIADIAKSNPVAVAEVDHQELWQRAALGVAAVSSTQGQVDRMLRSVEKELDNRRDVEMLGATTIYLEPA